MDTRSASSFGLLLLIAKVDAKQDRRAFLLDRFEALRVKPQRPKNGGSHLGRFDKACHRARLEIGV